MNPEKHLVEHERFEDLCMLSTAGELTPQEAQELHRHVASCSSCREALSECRQFVNAGMAYLASEFVQPDGEGQFPWAQADGRRELFSRLKARKTSAPARPSSWHVPPIRWIGLVAALILALGLLPVAYRSGERKGGHQASVAVAENHSLSERLQSLTAEKIALDNKLQVQANSLAELAAKMRQQTEDLAKLRDLDKTRQFKPILSLPRIISNLPPSILFLENATRSRKSSRMQDNRCMTPSPNWPPFANNVNAIFYAPRVLRPRFGLSRRG